MADDGGQRLLDVIDDPNALDEFLGTLSADVETDNVVASLARSLAAELETNCSTDPLFDSSASLTDISQSNVPFDFGDPTPNLSYGTQSSSSLNVLHQTGFHHSSLQLSLSQSHHSSHQYESTSGTLGYCDGSTQGLLEGVEATVPDSNYLSKAEVEVYSQSVVHSTTTTNVVENRHHHQNGEEPISSYVSLPPSLSESSSLSSSSVPPPVSGNTTGGDLPSQPTPAISSGGNSMKCTGSGKQLISTTKPTTMNETALPVPVSNIQSTAVYVTSDHPQYTSIGHLVGAAGQTATVLTATAAGMNQSLLAATNGGSLSLNAQSGFIIDSTTGQPMMVTTSAGGNAFGTNLLVAGVQPTYTVLPTQASLFPNAIAVQPTIQAIKTAHGTTASFLQASTTVASLVSGATTAGVITQTSNKTKMPPHLLPKPNEGGTLDTTATTITTQASNVNPGCTESIGQLIGQTATVTSAGGISLTQPSFALGAGGQVVQVSGVSTLNSLQAGSQAIIMNQFGQQMIVPAAAMGQSGVQFILRQQPQPQLLTIQAPASSQIATPTTTNGKVVRFVSTPQVPQVTQSSIQLQQIQTPSGPTWVAVRSTPVQQPVVSIQSQSQLPVVVTTAPAVIPSAPAIKTPTPPPPPKPPSPLQSQTIPRPPSQPTPPNSVTPPILPITTDTISACIQSVIERLRSPSPPSTTSSSVQSPISSTGTKAGNSPSPVPPPKKKPKYSKKKKVTLDLEQLLKQSGIMDEDLQDDGFGDFFGSIQPGAVTGDGLTAENAVTASPAVIQNGFHNNVYSNNVPIVNDVSKSQINLGTSSLGVPTHSHVLKPSTKVKQRKIPAKSSLVEDSESIDSNNTLTPVTAPIMPLKISKSKSKKKMSGSGDSIMNNLITTIEGANTVPDYAVIESISEQSPKSKPKWKKAKTTNDMVENNNVVTNSNFIPVPQDTPKKKSSKSKNTKSKVGNTDKNEKSSGLQTESPLSSLPPGILTPPQIAAVGPALSTPQPTRRIVQTIQLTPQNQTLLRNIQAQITKLLSLTSRNEVEENALQKLISLQAEVIKTGKPVPNPPHLQTLQSTPASIPPQAIQSSAASATAFKFGLSNTVTTPLKVPLATSPSGSVGVSTGIGDSSRTLRPVKIASATPMLDGALVNGGGPLKSTLSQPPPLLLKSPASGTTKIVITTGGKTGKHVDFGKTEINGVGSKAQLSFPAVASDSKLESKPSVPQSGTNEEITSSSVSITPTTTISTAVSGGCIQNGNAYYNSFEPEHAMIDEKKLEEQLIARLKQDEEARIQWRKEEFENRLSKDHMVSINPDYQTPFRSMDDSVERLMHFHVARDTAEITFEEFDNDFAETSLHLVNKFSGMIVKYRALLLKESMKGVECAERVMLERMFVAEEKLKLEHDRGVVQQGEILELPPPPPKWIPRIRQMVDSEMKEMERDTLANQQVQSAIDSIMSFDNGELGNGTFIDEREKVEYDAFGIPISNYNSGCSNSSSADIDEAVRSILL